MTNAPAWTPRDITLRAPVPTAMTAEATRTSAADATPFAETPAFATPVRRFSIDLRTAAWLVYLSGLGYFLISLGSGILRLYRLRAGAEVSVEGMRLAREIAGRTESAAASRWSSRRDSQSL